MVDMKNKFLEDANQFYKIGTLFGMQPLSNGELEFVSFASTLFSNVGSDYVLGEVMSLNKAINLGLDNLSFFKDVELVDRVKKILLSIPMYAEPDEMGYKTHIVFDVDDRTFKISKAGRVKHLVTPLEYGAAAPVEVTHEYLHMLKDTNFDEFKYTFKYSEVIPLFYELIKIQDSNKDLRSILINNRLAAIRAEANTFNIARIQEKESPALTSKLRYIESQSGKYILDLYYAFQLYDLYQSNPKVVLDSILKVLKHEKTTFQLLQEFNIFNSLNYGSYKENIRHLM